MDLYVKRYIEKMWKIVSMTEDIDILNYDAKIKHFSGWVKYIFDVSETDAYIIAERLVREDWEKEQEWLCNL